MSAVADCRHTPQCVDPLTHWRLIAAQPEPLPVGTPNHREWQNARNRVSTAALEVLAERDKKRVEAAVERLSHTTPDSRIRADWTLPPREG